MTTVVNQWQVLLDKIAEGLAQNRQLLPKLESDFGRGQVKGWIQALLWVGEFIEQGAVEHGS